MEHPRLGPLEEHGGSFVGNLILDGTSISLRVDPDDIPLDQALSLAVDIAISLSNYDGISKVIIARDLLETYNSGWNEYEEIEDDGSTTSVINPQLSSDEFKCRLTLSSVEISGDSSVAFWYLDGELFWGHSILVHSSHGTDFSNSKADLFG